MGTPPVVVVMGVASLWFSFRLGNRHVEAAKQAALTDR